MTTSVEYDKSWPDITESDLAGFRQELCDAIHKLESAFYSGKLSSVIADGRFAPVLGPSLHEAYKRLEGVDGPLSELRTNSVRTLIAQLQNDLTPKQISQAKVLTPLEESFPKDAPEEEPSSKFQIKSVEASLNNSINILLRFDQMLDVRFWQIGFTFDNPDYCDIYTQVIVRQATRRLASDLIGLQKILERFRPDSRNAVSKIIPQIYQKQFEHLILDILNETNRCATLANIEEDFLEKTDIRFKIPEIKRRRGARIQVTSIIDLELHDFKQNAIRRTEEFVFLSPLSLAIFADTLQGATAGDEISHSSSVTIEALQNCFSSELSHVPQIAEELKQILLGSLKEPTASPLGPSAQVPLPIRELIRIFVKCRAQETTFILRQRENRYTASETKDFRER